MHDLKLLTPAETAQALNVSEFTLESWRVRGCGPSYVKLTRKTVRYPLDEIELWLKNRTLSSTSARNPG